MSNDYSIKETIENFELAHSRLLTYDRFYLINEKIGMTYRLQEPQYKFYLQMFSYVTSVQREHITIEQIAKDLNISQNMVSDGLKLLCKESKRKHNPIVIEKYGKVICSIPLPSKSFLTTQILTWNLRSTCMLLLLSVIYLVINHKLIFIVSEEIFIGYQNYSIGVFESFEMFLTIYSSLLISIILHEFMHIIVAYICGIQPKTVSILLKYYLFPVFYVTYENMYKYSIKSRLQVLFAGSFANIILVIFGLTLFLLTNYNEIFIVFAFVNLFQCVHSLNFTVVSDGYYIVSTILDRENLLLKGYGEVKNLFIHKNKTDVISLGFGVVNATVVISTLILVISLGMKLYSQTGYVFISIVFMCMYVSIVLLKNYKILRDA